MAIVQQLLIVASKIIKGEFSKAELYGLLQCCTRWVEGWTPVMWVDVAV